MPRFLLIAATASAAFACYRLITREMQRVGALVEQERQAAIKATPGLDLVRDPATGIYRARSEHS